MPRRLTAAVKPPWPAKYSQNVPTLFFMSLVAQTPEALLVSILTLAVADERVSQDEDELTPSGGRRGVLRTAESPRSSASRTPFQRSFVLPFRALSFFLGAGSGFTSFRLLNAALALSTLDWSIGCGQFVKLCFPLQLKQDMSSCVG